MTEVRPRIMSSQVERLEDLLVSDYEYDGRTVYGSDFRDNLEKLLSELEE